MLKHFSPIEKKLFKISAWSMGVLIVLPFVLANIISVCLSLLNLHQLSGKIMLPEVINPFYINILVQFSMFCAYIYYDIKNKLKLSRGLFNWLLIANLIGAFFAFFSYVMSTGELFTSP